MDPRDFPITVAGQVYDLAVVREGLVFCALADWPATLPARLAAAERRAEALAAEVRDLRTRLAGTGGDRPDADAPAPESRRPPLTCPVPGCGKVVRGQQGLSTHLSRIHGLRKGERDAASPDEPAPEPAPRGPLLALIEPQAFGCACGRPFAESLRQPGRCIACTGEYQDRRAG